MNPDSPVTLRRLAYRGVVNFHLSWEEEGCPKEETFGTEAAAVVAMAAIETRLRAVAMAGKGLTVNPFGEAVPFITSKDVHFAALRLQPRGLVFRDAITGYVAAAAALQGMETGVADAAREYAEATKSLKAFDVSLSQVVFEWVELKKQVGDKPVFEVLRAYLKQTGKAAEGVAPEAGAAANQAGGSAGAPPRPIR